MTTTKVNLANTVEGILPVANGGTGSSTGVSPGGSTTQVQFNNAGAFGGSANLTFDGTTLTAAGLSDSGNLTFTGTGNRITGDFSNATQTNRVVFQTSTTNGNTTIGVIPNGTATTAVFRAFNNSDPTNASELSLFATSADMRVMSNITGTGTYLPLTMYTGGSERLRIDTSGRLLIGQTSPYDNATLSVTSPSQVFSVIADGGTTGNRSRGGFYHPATKVFALNVDQADGVLAFSQNTVERMRIDSSGNVGIGTNSPQASLHVSGAISNAPTGSGVLVGIQSDYAVIHLNGSGATGSFIDFSTSGTDSKGRILYDNTNNYMKFDVNATERMRIDSSGNVGIGTTDPSGFSSRLCVSGGRLTMAGGNRIGFWDSSNLNRVEINSPAQNTMAFYTADGATERFRIGSAGQFGIGGANYGTSGQVLTSNGSGSAPSWQNATSSTPSLQTVVFASSGSWTAPTGVTKIFAYCIGGGGGGGGTGLADVNAIAGGGGLAVGELTVVPGTTYTITVGAGGTGSNTTTGGSGGTSSIGALMSATGGAGGPTNGTDGASGSGSGGTVRNGGLVPGYADETYIGFFQFYGKKARTAGQGTAAVAWSISSVFLPGTGGQSETNNTGNNSSGGVGGAIIIQYVG